LTCSIQIDELKANAYKSAIADIDKVLDVEYAQSVLNQRREELIEPLKPRLRSMFDKRIIVDHSSIASLCYLDEFKISNHGLECLADDLWRRMSKASARSFRNRLYYKGFTRPDFMITFADTIADLAKTSGLREEKCKRKLFVPLNYGKFIYSCFGDRIFYYYIIDHISRQIVAQHEFDYMNMGFKVNAKAKSIVTVGYNRNNFFHFHIQIYNMKFELRA
jgi:hypothetical protein